MYLLDIFTNLERISDVCSDVGVSTITRRTPELTNQAHEYISKLHMRNDDEYNALYSAAHKEFFGKLNEKSQYTTV